MVLQAVYAGCYAVTKELINPRTRNWKIPINIEILHITDNTRPNDTHPHHVRR